MMQMTKGSYQVTVFKPHKLFSTLIFVHSVVISDNAFTIGCGLSTSQWQNW